MTNNKPAIRELVLQNGFSYPTDEELIMLILGSGSPGMPVEQLSRRVVSALEDSNSDDRLQHLRAIRGIGESKALAVAAALELGRRRCCHLHAVVRKATDLIPFIRSYSMQEREHMLSITLNGAHEIIAIRVISIGTKTRTLVHPREIYAQAVAEHASAVIICHNHPDGDCTPSDEDISTTKVLMTAGDVLGVDLIDHIIIDRDTYFSFMEHGLLFHDQ